MLLFDAGNSRCKWAWIINGVGLRQGVLDNSETAAWQALRVTFAQLATPQKIFASNVAGAEMAHNLRELCAVWPCPVEFITAQAEQCGVRNRYEQPSQLGSDRWAALVAAWHIERQACLVVNCGTATTVDALSDSGEFLGGLILPGIELMQFSLQNSTAQLGAVFPGFNGKFIDFPRNTADAIVSGALRASIGAIQQQYKLLGVNGARCILSGGAAASILPHLGLPAEQVDNLVLLGMQIIGQNCSMITKKEMVSR
jgi:type III pantothenate kinase